MSIYTLNGQLLRAPADGAVHPLRVEAHDAKAVLGRALGIAETNPDGTFTFKFTSEEVFDLFDDRIPEVYFRVIDEGDEPILLLADTQDKQTWVINGPATSLKIRLGASSLGEISSPDSYEVYGRVAVKSTVDLVDCEVRAYDVTADGDGSAIGTYSFGSNPDGRYYLTYPAPSGSSGSGKELADLKLKVIYDDGSGEEQEIATSEVFYQAPSAMLVNLAQEGADSASEHTKVTTAISNARGSSALSSVDDATVAFLAKSAKQPIGVVKSAVKAAALKSGMTANASEHAIYGMLRQGLPEDRDGFFRMSAKSRKDALQRAIDDGLTGASLQTELDLIRDEVVTRMKENGGSGNVDDMLQAAGIDNEETRGTFLSAYAEYEDDIASFWEDEALWGSSGSLHADVRSAKETIQVIFKVGSLTRYFMPLIDDLAAARANEEPEWTEFEDLAEFTVSDWIARLASIEATAPTGVPGEGTEELRTNYAKLLVVTLDSLFPTRAQKKDLETGDKRADFFAAYPDFDFRKHRVKTYFAENSPTIPSGTTEEELIVDLERMERLLKLTPCSSHVKALEGGGFGSAASIVRTGKKRFITIMEAAEPSLSEAEALVIFDKAVKVAAAAESVRALLDPNINAPISPHQPGIDPAPQTSGITSQWEHYFGEANNLTCQRCDSIHGPAAYMVDTLVWLDQFEAVAAGDSAQDVLLVDRRPDIGHIELSCEATEAPLPYIDIVNEVLEWKVSPPTFVSGPDNLRLTTEGDTDDRLAMPYVFDEASYEGAYETLKDEIYPWKMPFSLWAEQTRAYLMHLGVQRHELMRLLQVTAGPTDAAIAREYFGMSLATENAIRDNTSSTGGELWGLGSTDDLTALGGVAALSKQSGLTYEQLVELLETPFTTAIDGVAVTMSPLPRDVKGDLSQVQLSGFTSTALSFFTELQRLIRLHHFTGWPIAELAKAVDCFDAADAAASITSSAMLQRMMNLDRVSRRLRVPHFDLLPLWSVMDTADMPNAGLASMYTRVFRKQSLSAIQGGLFDADPANITGSVDDHARYISAALSLDAPSFVRLTANSSDLMLDAPVDGAIDNANISSLSELYRYARLARAMRLTVADLLIFSSLATTAALGTTATPGDTLAFIDDVEMLRQTGLSADDVHYICRHVERPDAGTLVYADKLDEVTTAIEVERSKVDIDTRPVGEVSSPELRDKLVSVLDRVRDAEDDAAARDATISADVDGLMRLIEEETIATVDTDRSTKLAVVDKALSGVFGDLEPFRRFLVPDQPQMLTSCLAWFEPTVTGLNNLASGGASVTAHGATVDAINGGYLFDGVDDYLAISSATHAGSDHTFVFGVDINETGAEATLLDLRNSNNSHVSCLARTSETGDLGYAVASWQAKAYFYSNFDASNVSLGAGDVVDAWYDTSAGGNDADPSATKPVWSTANWSGGLGSIDVVLGTMVWPQPSINSDDAWSLLVVNYYDSGVVSGYKVAGIGLGGTGAIGTFSNGSPGVFDGAYRPSDGPAQLTVDTEQSIAWFTKKASQRFEVFKDGQFWDSGFYDGTMGQWNLQGTLVGYNGVPYGRAYVRAAAFGFTPLTDDERDALLAWGQSQLDGSISSGASVYGLTPAQGGRQVLTYSFDSVTGAAHVTRNGQPVQSADSSYVGIDAASATIQVGASGSTAANFFNGAVRGFGMFDEALSLDDRAQVNGRMALIMKRVEDRRLFVYNALRQIERELRVLDALKQVASVGLDLPESVGGYLIDNLDAVPASGSLKLGHNFRLSAQSAHIATDPGATDAEVSDALTRLHKVSFLVDKLDMKLRDVQWLCSRTEAGWLDLDALPIVAPDTTTVSTAEQDRMAALLKLVRTYALAPHVTDGRDGLYDIAEFVSEAATTPSLDDVAAYVAEGTRWTASDIATLHTRFHAGDVAEFADLNAIVTMVEAAEALRKMGVTATEAEQWLDPDEVFSHATNHDAKDTAQAVLRAARARHSDEDWADVARPIRDAMRTRQRDALVAYLVQNEADVDDADDLYEKLLIDVDMSPCALTTRVKAALNSVQLFIHRAFLGLEDDIVLDRDAAEQWEWRKNYTLWEANRKVFLYPENWIEPELRDDKTPFFEELEGSLREGELTERRVERIYQTYLERLSEVAQLDVVGVFHEYVEADENSPSVDNLHVFAQSPGAGAGQLYYRKRVDGAYWTPWSNVDIETTSRCFLPFVLNGRIVLFWLDIQDGFEAQKTSQGDPPAVRPPSIRIAMTEHDGEGWSHVLMTEPVEAASLLREGYPPTLILQSDVATNETTLHIAEPEYRGDHANNGTTESIGDKIYELVSFAKATIDPITGRLDSVTVRDIQDGELLPRILPAVTKTYHSSLVQYRLDVAAGQNALATSGPRVSLDKTIWASNESHIDYPMGELFARVGGHLLFATRTPAPSRNPADHVDPEPANIAPMVSASFGGASSMTLPNAQFDIAKAGGAALSYKPFKLIPTSNYANEASLSLSGSSNAVLQKAVQQVPIKALPQYSFACFEHRLVTEARKAFFRHGTRGLREYDLLAVDGQSPLQERTIAFFDNLTPNRQIVVGDDPVHEFDFSYGGAYSTYNWELFFHIPLSISQRLRDEGRFEDAVKWLHAIFDPREASPTADLKESWKFKPFRDIADSIGLAKTDAASSNPTTQLGKWLKAALSEDPAAVEAGFEAQLDALEGDPFNPHRLARMRQVAYQKAVIRLYVETLIDWADMLFSRDTVESIVEAQQLYMLAGQVIGKPVPLVDATSVGEPGRPEPVCFFDVEDRLDDLNGAVAVEATIAIPDGNAVAPNPTGIGSKLLFCVPPNNKQRELWATVQDRLFKIRNCQNIDGVVRQLPIFQPPIDPALLVRARAAGLDINDILSDLYAPPPLHRFAVLHQRAMDFSGFVASIGQALLSALEKKDAEALSQLRAGHEVSMLSLVRETRKAQVREAEQSLLTLRESKTLVELRRDHYADLLEVGLNTQELRHQDKTESAFKYTKQASDYRHAAQMLGQIPDLNVGAAGLGPANFISFGGSLMMKALELGSNFLSDQAQQDQLRASQLATTGGYERRKEEWGLQLSLAEEELTQIERQVVAAEIRVEIARNELTTHDLQREQSRETEAFLRQKYTNKELYDWMARELSALHYEAFQLAFRMARRAERAYQFERADFGRIFIQHGYFQNSRKGLLSGERLQLDLRRMEEAYLDSDRRDLEITKHISFAEMFPAELHQLRTTGATEVNLQEFLFDLDYPGHYLRRIKSVSVTLPAVTGPHSGVNCTMTMLSNKFRKDPSLTGGGYAEAAGADTRFNYGFNSIASVCTSSGLNDGGVFELNFREERLLPFEGAGAVGRWRIEMPQDTNRFDLSTLTDVVMHVQYMARDGGQRLREKAKAAAIDRYEAAWRIISVREEFAKAWEAFKASTDATPTLTFDMAGKYPFIPGSGAIDVTQVYAAADATTTQSVDITLGTTAVNTTSIQLTETMPTASLGDPTGETSTVWQVAMSEADRDTIGDLFVIVRLERAS